MTIETTYTAARCQLTVLMVRVVQDREIVIVWRRQGGDVALVGADELERLLETALLLRSPRNVARLPSVLERARSDGLPFLRLEELKGRQEAKATVLRRLVPPHHPAAPPHVRVRRIGATASRLWSPGQSAVATIDYHHAWPGRWTLPVCFSPVGARRCACPRPTASAARK